MRTVWIEDLFGPDNDTHRSAEIRNVPCTICQECDHEQIGYQAQSRIDKLVERAAKGKLKDRVVTM